MPFVTQDRRDIIDEHGPHGLDSVQPGDLCYIFYKRLVAEWKANPRWTTAHNLYKELFYMPIGKLDEDEYVAKSLAWQVFFNIYVMDYEQRKRLENGDI